MNGTVIYKMSGSGNDFVFLDGRHSSRSDWTPQAIAKICARRSGVGADGLAILDPGSQPGRVKFTFFNDDGSEAPMCGNAALCATRLAVRLELVCGPEMVLETRAGNFPTRWLDGPGERAEIQLANVQSSPVDIEPAAGESSIGFFTVGVPHLVVLVDDLDTPDLMERGRELRYHVSVQPDGANVNFVARREGGGVGWRMRTYERGVERETVACGTGAVACAAVLAHDGKITLPWEVESASGMKLEVYGKLDGSCDLAGICDPRLVGEGRLVMQGVLVQAGFNTS